MAIRNFLKAWQLHIQACASLSANADGSARDEHAWYCPEMKEEYFAY
jgi:hypothetical protein